MEQVLFGKDRVGGNRQVLKALPQLERERDRPGRSVRRLAEQRVQQFPFTANTVLQSKLNQDTVCHRQNSNYGQSAPISERGDRRWEMAPIFDLPSSIFGSIIIVGVCCCLFGLAIRRDGRGPKDK